MQQYDSITHGQSDSFWNTLITVCRDINWNYFEKLANTKATDLDSRVVDEDVVLSVLVQTIVAPQLSAGLGLARRAPARLVVFGLERGVRVTMGRVNVALGNEVTASDLSGHCAFSACGWTLGGGGNRKLFCCARPYMCVSGPFGISPFWSFK